MTAKDIIAKIKNENIDFIDFRFTDLRGKTYQISYMTESIDLALLEYGIMFDGSSVPGWKAINESDMILKPDYSSHYIDPFIIAKTLVIHCDVMDPKTGDYYMRDARSVAKRAEEFLSASGIADIAYMGPEIEFYVFDEVDYEASPYESNIKLQSSEFSRSGGGYHMEPKDSYCAVSPRDTMYEMRLAMMYKLKEIGLVPLLHHHEVAPAQMELGFKYASVIDSADNCLKYKYAVRKVAEKFAKSVTFMPKPIPFDNGSGMHVHQSLWKDGKNLFAGNEYAGLSDTCLYYIGGIMRHARALTAFTNPTINSYKRLVRGYEAPVSLAYSNKNRSAAIRIPHVHSSAAKRIETRFPDPLANPYLAFSAMLMAGIDGIINKIHPGEAVEEDLYHFEDNSISKLSTSLEESLQALERDHAFLTAGGVFNDELITTYIKQKRMEIEKVNLITSPIEFKLYYSL